MTKILVTGGSGFVASHLIDQLLAAGHDVNATVRDLKREDKVAPLRRLAERHPGKLTLFEADLLKPGSFDAAMSGCSVVHHVASPFLMPEQIKDGQSQVVEPALQGTRNVLDSVNRTESVRRVVLTSTVGAIFGDYIDVRAMKDGVLTEAYFNESSTADYNPYHYSKVAAEKLAWEMCGAQNRWDMVCINPGLILGPSLTGASDSGSLFLLDEMLKGRMFYGAADLSFTTVDVRDVAAAHIAAADTPSASGRYILAHEQMTSFLDMARMFRRVHARPDRLPRYQLPNLLVRIIGPLFGLSQHYMSNHLGIRFPVDNHRSIEELGVRYRPLERTLADHYHSWAALQPA